MANGDWTDQKNDLIVADYFAMLEPDLWGQHYNKADHNRKLQSQTGRDQTFDDADIIEFTDKLQVLRADEFESVQATFKPFMDQAADPD